MKSKKTFFTLLCLLIFIEISFNSCGKNELEEYINKEYSVIIEGNKVNVINNTLSFKDQNSFEKTLQTIKLKLNENNENLNSNLSAFQATNKYNQYQDFKSLYDLFNEALHNADSYYQRENGYEEFKEKYKTLYYPEYKDDYSVYLPVSDNELAKLLNHNGDVLIKGKLLNMKNINSYSQLQELGIAMYNLPNKTRARITPIPDGPIQIPSIILGQEYVDGKIKFWLTVEDINHVIYKFNLNFRKKGFLGFWYNLKADSMCTLFIEPLGIFTPYDQILKFYPSVYNEKSPHLYTYNNGSNVDVNIASGSFRFKIDDTAERRFRFYLK